MPTRNLRKMHSKCLAFVSQCQWQQVAGKLDFQFYGSVCISTFKISSWWKCFLPFTCVSLCQSWVWDLKNIHVCPLFFKYFQQFKEKQWPSSFFQSALRLNDGYNHAHTPGQHKWLSPGQEPDYKCSKKVEVWRSCLMFRQKGTWIVIFSNLELTFYVQDCHSQTAKVEYQG